jgi:hypothetical protein
MAYDSSTGRKGRDGRRRGGGLVLVLVVVLLPLRVQDLVVVMGEAGVWVEFSSSSRRISSVVWVMGSGGRIWEEEDLV